MQEVLCEFQQSCVCWNHEITQNNVIKVPQENWLSTAGLWNVLDNIHVPAEVPHLHLLSDFRKPVTANSVN